MPNNARKKIGATMANSARLWPLLPFNRRLTETPSCITVMRLPT